MPLHPLRIEITIGYTLQTEGNDAEAAARSVENSLRGDLVEELRRAFEQRLGFVPTITWTARPSPAKQAKEEGPH